MARTLSAAEKRARVVPAKVTRSKKARGDAIGRATSKVKAKAAIDFVRTVRG
ncbi:MAG: hypothetical protein HYU54_09690 [Actinobacteria bacterium]|nr:hypothetical protein [Actinomycetota bacterium]